MWVDFTDVKCLRALPHVQNRATKEKKSIPDVFVNEGRIKQFSYESKQKPHQGHGVEEQNPLEHSHEDVGTWLTTTKSQMSE